MSSILSRIMEQIEQTDGPKITQVVDSDGLKSSTGVEIKSLEENYSMVSLKKNSVGTPITGYSMAILADEFGSMLAAAMHKVGVNSVSAETFGAFDKIGLVPKGFKLVEDTNSNKRFYVLRDSNRTVELYKKIITAINSTVSESVSFPYTIKTSVSLPLRFNASNQDFDYVKIDIESLTLTMEEITRLDYTFITEIRFYKAIDVEETDLVVLTIDREEWKRTPFRTANNV